MQAIGENTVLAQRYTLTRKLAGRPEQQLWIGTDSTLGREVTVTVFEADSPHAEAALDSARRAAGVEDRHLPRVLDVGSEGGAAYVITEALHGAESIAAMLQFDPLPAEEVRRMIGEAASGLGAASARGLHHLQLTPHDIVTSPDGAVSVLGLSTDAALAGADDLSSEEASRADTVALVQIVYAGLTRRWPGDEPVPGLQDVSRRADGELPAPSELVSGVPGDLDTLCRTTLGADEGPRTPGELARQLAPWSSERVTTSTRRTTGSGGQSAATLHAVPGGDRSGTSEQTAPVVADEPASPDGPDAAETSVPAKIALPKAAVATAPAGDDDDTALLSGPDLERARGRSAAAHTDQDDDYDPSFTDLEPPVPGLDAQFEPDHQSSRLALLLVVLLVVVAVIFAAIGLRGIGGSSSPDEAASAAASRSASASASASAAKSKSATAKPQPTTKPLQIERTTSYGLDGGDNSELAAKATDDDPDSTWNSYEYTTADGRGGGQGTGLLLNLGSVKSVDNVKITTSGGPSTIEIYVSDNIEPVTSRDPETTLKGKGTQTAYLGGVDAKYITIWVTELSKKDNGKFEEQISDVKVYS